MCILGVSIFELYRFLPLLLYLWGYITQKKRYPNGHPNGCPKCFFNVFGLNGQKRDLREGVNS